MPIDIQWVETEENILHWVFEGEWTLQEFREAVEQTLAIAEPVKRFDVILDMRKGITPRFPLTAFQRVLNKPIVKRDMVVLISQDNFLLATIQILQKIGMPNLSKRRLAIVNHFDEATERIHENRELIMEQDGTY